MARLTLSEFLTQDMNTLTERNVELAALYKAIAQQVTERCMHKGKYGIVFSPVQCTDDGDCVLRIGYR